MTNPSQWAAAQAFGRRFGWWCGLLILVGTVSSLSDAQAFWARQSVGFVVSSPLRLLREGVYFCMLLDFSLTVLRTRRIPWFSRDVMLLWAALGVFLCFEAAYSIVIGFPVGVIAAGLRLLEYLPLMFVAVVVYRTCGDAPFYRIASLTFLFLLGQSVVGLVEIRYAPPVFGATFLGSRPFGTMPHANIFGSTLVVGFEILLMARWRWRWHYFPLVLLLVFASGSRGAQLGLVLILAIYALSQLRSNYERLILILLGALSAPFVLVLVTSPLFTGRQDAATGGYKRFEVWTRVINMIETPMELLTGWGVGVGSNTTFSLFGDGVVRKQYIGDNLFIDLIGSFGLLGNIIFLGIVFILLWKLRKSVHGLVTWALFIFNCAFSMVLELYPLNVMFMLMFGWLWGKEVRRGPSSASLSVQKEHPDHV